MLPLPFRADFGPQYLVLTLGDAKQATSTINRTLNPEWNQTIELPVVGMPSTILEGVCWDKDRFGKDYMGEFDVMLEDIFSNGSITQEVR
jgi:phosphatidylserine decarboxylase